MSSSMSCSEQLTPSHLTPGATGTLNTAQVFTYTMLLPYLLTLASVKPGDFIVSFPGVKIHTKVPLCIVFLTYRRSSLSNHELVFHSRPVGSFGHILCTLATSCHYRKGKFVLLHMCCVLFTSALVKSTRKNPVLFHFICFSLHIIMPNLLFRECP